jgi:hypothetical protein
MWCQEGNEVVHIPTQQSIAREAEPGFVPWEQMRGTDGNEIAILCRVQGDVGNEAHSEPEAYIRFDDVRVAGRERHIRGKPCIGESVMQGRRAVETEHVGHDRVRGEIFERRLADRGQRMPLRHNDPPVPSVTRQQDVLAKQLVRARSDGEVDTIELRHFRDLLGGTLVQVKLHVGVSVAEGLDNGRQDVTRLRVGGPDGQRAAILVFELGRDTLDVLCFAQQLQRMADDALTWRGYFGQRTSTAHEDIEPELVFQELELLAHRGLCRTQFGRGGRNIEIVLRDSREKTQLLYLHCRGVYGQTR